MCNDSQQTRRQLIWGILIICVGVSFLLAHNDWVAVSQLWRYWPVVLGAFGLNNMIPPTTGKRFVEGFSQVGVALWFYVASERLWGLTYGNSWPLLVIIGGVSIVLQPLMSRLLNKNKEM